MKTWNWAILGCGHIAEKFSEDLKLLPNARLYACASRTLEKAEVFAAQYGYEKAYGSYQAMVADPEVHVVYVASPHSHHLEHSILCLEHKKAVLCEKAFALNLNQLEQIFEAAKRNKCFLMEAFWTRFQPGFLKLKELLKEEVLGRPKMMRSDFAFTAPYDPNKRLYNLELGGGSLLDIGIYPVFMAIQAFGRPDEIKTIADFSPTGSEESIAIIFKYADGRMATLQSSFAVQSNTQSEYWCENGFIKTSRLGIDTTYVELWTREGLQKQFAFPYPQSYGYNLEAAHVMDCLDKGLVESPILPLAFSALLMETLDRIRAEAGIKFPFED